MTLHATTVTRNFAQGGGGIANGGFLAPARGHGDHHGECHYPDNVTDNRGGAGITNGDGGTMVITNTTVSANRNNSSLPWWYWRRS